MPRALRQKQWSPLNVPMMWEAAGDSPACPVVEWLHRVAVQIVDPVQFHEHNDTASLAVTLGWNALRGILKGWGVTTREDLTVWFLEDGYPAAHPGNITDIGLRSNCFNAPAKWTRVPRCWSQYSSLLPFIWDQVRSHGRSTESKPRSARWSEPRSAKTRGSGIELVPLRSCPHHLRGRLTECLGLALHERFRARSTGWNQKHARGNSLG